MAVLASADFAFGQGFHFGVNGHPGVQEGYRHIPVTEQLNLVAELGAKWYRCDVSESDLRSRPAEWDKLVDEAARRGIRILPVIFPDASCRGDLPSARIRERCAEFGRSIAARYKGRITHWELDNELDNWALVRKGEKCPNGLLWQWGDPHGNEPYHFQEDRYQKARAEFEGLHAGLKAGDPAAKTMIDCSWIHYGFAERLFTQDKLAVDILAWHWYSEMGDPAKANTNINLPEHLKRYGRPIWFTELNRRGGSMDGQTPGAKKGDGAKEQADYLVRIAKQLRATPSVEALFMYELLDEPYFGPDNPESHYGLVETRRGADGHWKIGPRKPAFDALRAAFRAEPR